MKHCNDCWFLLCLFGLLARGCFFPVAADEGEFFEKKIRPLLVDHCHACHSAGTKQKANLLLDHRAGLLKGGDTGPAVVPGAPEKSLLIKAVRYADAELRMPPRSKLSNEQIADLTAWVRSGLPWPETVAVRATAPGKEFNLAERRKHWAFQPVQPATPPAVRRNDWPGTPVDAFILAKLDACGLAPAPPADKRTLLRRITFDLIGLPPTPAEIDAFLADESPDAYEKLVERLLASPHYGERWGRHWLDLVRYAETLGHEFDSDIPDAWRYRDYVIRAFNADLPYDQFVTEHVAGDLLPRPRRHPVERFNESILATGYWFLGEAKHSPVDVRGDEADRLDNQIDVFGKAFLGLTVACARCHDHKFDPITTKDYYSLTSYLRSSRFQRAFLDDPEPLRQRVRQLHALREKEKELLVSATEQARVPARGVSFVKNDPRYVVFEDFDSGRYAAWFVTGEAFGAAPGRPGNLVPGPQPAVLTVPTAHSGLVSNRLQGVLRSPTFVISKKKIWLHVAGHDTQINLILDGYQQIRDPIYGGLTLRMNKADRPGWRGIDVSMWPGHLAYLELIDDGPGYLAVDQILFGDDGPPAALPDAAPQALDVKERPELAAVRQQISRLELALPQSRRAPALADGTGRDERVCIRGNHKNLGEPAPRRFLEVFGGELPAPAPGSGRVELARRLVDATNPLVARVLVNRLWQHHFGEGLVRSVDNFGILGEPPTHPELLDYLATEFVHRGWSLKAMHRLMVLSSTYRMASRGEAIAEERDPQNKRLHRMPVRRLEAECIRDAILAVSGRLDHTPFGPSVPPYLTPFMAGRGRPTASGPLDGDGRRSVYLSVRRNFLSPLLLAFDYPIPLTTMGRRSVSNVPAQALALLNNPFVMQQAEIWAQRVLAEKGQSAAQRVERMYVTAFGRPPTPDEVAKAISFVEDQGSGTAAWADLGHVLLNVKEFIFVP